ncbi:uncharacterized protein AAG666_004988 [Megaptera novaeangliae]
MARASGPRQPAGCEAAGPGPGGPRGAASAPSPRPGGPLHSCAARSAAAGPGWARGWAPRAERRLWRAQALRRPGPALRAAMLASSSASASSGPRGRASAPGSRTRSRGARRSRVCQSGSWQEAEVHSGGIQERIGQRDYLQR